MARIIMANLVLACFIGACTGKPGKGGDNNWPTMADSLARQTFDTLRSSLLTAIGQKGFPGAVSYCNTQALKLTETYAGEGISVERVTDRTRNPSNAPDSMELRILAAFRERKASGQQLEPVAETDATSNHHYFKPILIQAMCLHCHGEPGKDIQQETWAAIQSLYPADSAFGYKEGDLRGAWHIRFKADKP